MAEIYPFTEAQKKAWAAWVAERPPNVREVAERFPPNRLFRLRDSGHRVFATSFQEMNDGSVTLTVAVSGEFNLVAFERNVFGIKPEDLEECDLPREGERVGNVGIPIEIVKEYMKNGEPS